MAAGGSGGFADEQIAEIVQGGEPLSHAQMEQH
jgi:hypothetical protein